MNRIEMSLMIAGLTAMSFGARPSRQYQSKPKPIQTEESKQAALDKAQEKRKRKAELKALQLQKDNQCKNQTFSNS